VLRALRREGPSWQELARSARPMLRPIEASRR
jgi:hypothetical protein